MRTIYFWVLSCMLCSMPLLYGQQTERSPELQSILDKMDYLGKLDPAGKDPYHKLSPAEKQIFREFEKKRNEESLKKNGAASQINAKLVTRAYGTDVRNGDFGWVPLTPPLTETVIAPLTGSYYCDDMAANGNLYAVNNDTKNLVTFNSSGVPTVVGPLGITAAESASGLSWNWTNNTMYLITTSGPAGAILKKLYTVNLSNGTATYVGSFGGPAEQAIWLEIDNTGNAYYADITSDRLFGLDLTTLATVDIGPLGIAISFAQDADFNRETNVLYMAAYRGSAVGQGQLASVNTSTGAATVIGEWVPATAGDTVEFATFTLTNSIPGSFLATDEVEMAQTSVYPNPTTGIIHIDSKDRIESAEIYNMEGRLLKSVKLKGNRSEIDITEFEDGVYLLRTMNNGKGETRKIIKK